MMIGRAAVLVLLLVFSSLGSVSRAQEPDASAPPPRAASGFVPGEVLVKLKPSPRSALAEARTALRRQALQRFGAAPARELRLQGRRERPGRWVKLVAEGLRGDRTRTRELLAELRRDPAVEHAELNVYLTADHFPDDPYFASSGAWGQAFLDLWGLDAIEAGEAWDTARGEGVVVAVIDTGLDDVHQDLAANVWRNPGELGLDGSGRDRSTNGIDDDGNGFVDDWRGWNFVADGNDPFDDHGHGTHVAGTIAAVSDNSLGIAGVAPRAHVIGIKALDRSGTGTVAQVSEAIRYAADQGAAVINLSLGGLGETPQTLADAIDYAHDVKGVVVVTSAGNNNMDVGLPGKGFFPGNLRGAITVSAFDHNDLKASFSNHGAKIDVAAPGGGGTEPASAYHPYRSVLSLLASGAGSSMTGAGQLIVGGSYLRQAGTSMAAPHVSGVAALVKSLRPSATPEEIRQSLRLGSDDVGALGFDVQAGYGRVNAAGALVVSPLAAQLTHPNESVSGAAIADVRGSAAGSGFAAYRLEWGLGSSPTSWQTIHSSTTPVTNGSLGAWNLQGVRDGTHTLRLVASSGTGQEYVDRMAVVVDSLVITEPSLDEIPLIGPGEPVSIVGTVEPFNFVSYTMRAWGRRTGWADDSRFTLTGGGLAPVRNGLLGTWDPSGLPADHYTLYVTASVSPAGTLQETTSVIYDPRLHPGWPVEIGNIGSGMVSVSLAITEQLNTADVNQDGKEEILVAYGNVLHVLDDAGNEMPGWPQLINIEGQNLQNGVAIGDLTGDGAPEIVAATWGGYVHVWSADGTLLTGWPRYSSGSRFVAIDDLDGDGANEIVTTGSNYIDVLDVDGAHFSGFPLFRGSVNPVAIGDLDGDGYKELVVANTYAPGALFAVSHRGLVLPGWPREINPAAPSNIGIQSYPVLGDLDWDRDLEIVINGYSGLVFAFHHDGTNVAGWPQLTREARVNPPALGDLDGDGLPEVIAGIGTVHEASRQMNYLYAWHGDGTPVAGWPVPHEQIISATFFGFGAPVVADLEGDGLADVFGASDTYANAHYALNGFRRDGSSVADFPRPTKGIGAGADGTAAIADIDGDGLLEMAWLDIEKRLYVWDFDAATTAARPWSMNRADAGRRARLAGVEFVRIDGRILDETGAGLAGVLVSVAGTVAASVSTDASGSFALTGLIAGGDYTVTAFRSGFDFTPQSFAFTDLRVNERADFGASGQAETVSLALAVTGVEGGRGTVFVDPPGSYCDNVGGGDASCVQTHPRGAIVTALAMPLLDSKFLGWSGVCSGTGPCVVALDGDRFLEASFLGPQELVVHVEGIENGSGAVTIDPPGTLCELASGVPTHSCSAFLPPDTVVTLDAIASPDSLFLGWSGACSGAGPCSVALSDGTGVFATFGIRNHPPVAEAGPSQTVELGLVAVLDGSLSSDPDGDPLTYLWTNSLGEPFGSLPVVSLSLPLGSHRFHLAVTDSSGARSEDFVDVAVIDTTPPLLEPSLPGGSSVPEGYPLVIEWTAADNGLLAGFDVLVSGGGARSFLPIPECAGLPGGARSCNWASPGPPSTEAVLRVVARDGSGNEGLGDVPLSILAVQRLTLSMAHRRDDAEETASGSVSLSSSDLDLSQSFVALRYVQVAIPRGARILSARVELAARGTRSSSTALTIRGEASDNAPSFTTSSRNLSSRPPTIASVPWQPEPWSAGTGYRTPEIQSIVQEIVDRAGWQSGRALVLTFSRGTGKREATSANSSLADAPRLIVEYVLEEG